MDEEPKVMLNISFGNLPISHKTFSKFFMESPQSTFHLCGAF